MFEIQARVDIATIVLGCKRLADCALEKGVVLECCAEDIQELQLGASEAAHGLTTAALAGDRVTFSGHCAPDNGVCALRGSFSHTSTGMAEAQDWALQQSEVSR